MPSFYSVRRVPAPLPSLGVSREPNEIMNSCCPLASLLKNRGLLLALLVAVPFGLLLASAVGGRLAERAAGPTATCPATGAAGPENSCESVHVRLRQGATGDGASEPAFVPALCPSASQTLCPPAGSSGPAATAVSGPAAAAPPASGIH
jgi:hypothetical protein